MKFRALENDTALCIFELEKRCYFRRCFGGMAKLSSLVDRIEGFQDFKFGQNLDFENKSSEFDYGFVATFADQTALQRYANDPQHLALGGQLVEMCFTGHNGIIVFDLSV